MIRAEESRDAETSKMWPDDGISSSYTPVFRRWELQDRTTIAPLVPGCRRGIYVLEFDNGERYVGKASDVVRRYATHRHGSRHHAPWPDVVAIEFMEVAEGDLDVLERMTIRVQRHHYSLRNVAFNFGHWAPSPLDYVIPVEQQKHWASGNPTYDANSFADASNRRGQRGGTKLFTKRRGRELLPSGRSIAEAVVDELAQVVAAVIPNAVETEGRFWSISDYPETAGGRFATLNVGWLELAWFPRARFEPKEGGVEASNGLMFFLNAALGTFVDETEVLREFSVDDEVEEFFEVDGIPVTFIRRPQSYSVPVDCMGLPLGTLGVDELDTDERQGVRNLVLHAMRAGSARINARSYSPELTRLVYKRITERY